MTRKAVNEFVNLDIINDKELFKLFGELTVINQNKIIYNGIKKSAKIIINAVSDSFESIKKNKSKTGYRNFKQSLKIEDYKTKKINDVGVKVGLKGNEAYKFKWLEKGTKERQKNVRGRKNKPKSVGRIERSDFFYKSVLSSKDAAQSNIIQSVSESMSKVISKYEKN